MHHKQPYILLAVLALMAAAFISIDSVTALLPSESPSFALLAYAPIVMFSTAGMLGLQLYQSRIFCLAVLLAFVHFSIIEPKLPGIDVDLDIRLQALAATFPASVLAIFVIDEAKLLSAKTIIRLSLSIGLPVTAMLIMDYPAIAEQLNMRLFSFEVQNFSHWAMVIAIFSGLAYVWITNRFKDKTAKRILIGTGLASLPLYLFFSRGVGVNASPTEALIASTTMGVMLLYTVYRIYWERVYIDDLTDIPNRRALDEAMRFLNEEYQIAMVDIDHFKKFNDRFGHQTGDHVLRRVAQHLQKSRLGNAFRYGGEEFCIIYHKREHDDVVTELEDLRLNLYKQRFVIRRPESERKLTTPKDRGKVETPKEKRVRISISIGLANKDETRGSAASVIAAADQALYKAKRKGRNQLVINAS